MAVTAPAQVWIEADDAPSFPDGAAQVTRGAESLDGIVGTTGGGDLRDACCIKIVEPGSFLATTDPTSHPGAAGDFDTRLFLFRPDGAAVLANDDTPPSQAPFLSTLTGVATDGSGFVLNKPGEYRLVVAGFPDDPNDFNNTDLFVLTPPDVIAAPTPAAGIFQYWDDGSVATGNYTVALVGVAPCVDALDAVFGNDDDNARFCVGNGDGSFDACRNVPAPAEDTSGMALDFIDGDGALDAVFGRSGKNRVCLGNGYGGFASCADVSSDTKTTVGAALGFVDTDDHLDAVFGNLGTRNRYCLGNGNGGFACSDVGLEADLTVDIALGLLNDDGIPDLVVTNLDDFNEVCLGNGSGGFDACSNIEAAGDDMHRGVALGDLDGDDDLDAVFANVQTKKNSVCLADGAGGFPSCTDIGVEPGDSFGVALGLVDEDDVLDAVFANFLNQNWVCLGDGSGGFASCAEVDSVQKGSIPAALGELGNNDLFADGFESADTSAWSDVVP